jgi:hypothetical protein
MHGFELVVRQLLLAMRTCMVDSFISQKIVFQTKMRKHEDEPVPEVQELPPPPPTAEGWIGL